VDDLQRALAAEGFLPDERPYRPHLTLARGCNAAPRQDWGPPIIWNADDLRLARGVGGTPPRYAPRVRWTLS
jgi:2'-5' RNA ligase